MMNSASHSGRHRLQVVFIHKILLINLSFCIVQVAWTELSHLVADHDVGDLGLAVHVLMFLLIGEN